MMLPSDSSGPDHSEVDDDSASSNESNSSDASIGSEFMDEDLESEKEEVPESL